VRLGITVRVCANLDFEDALVTKLDLTESLQDLCSASKLVVVPVFDDRGATIKLYEALAAGGTVISTEVGCRAVGAPSEAIVGLDMIRAPEHAAETILRLLADDDERESLKRRGRDFIATQQSTVSYALAMNRVLLGVSEKRGRFVA